MTQRYRRIQEQLFTRTRDHFGLSDSEALLILDDIVLNLEALATDLVPREDLQVDPARSPQRLMQALGCLSDRLECAVLAEIVAHLLEADVLDGGPLPDRAVEPLTHFVQGLRKAMPPVCRDYATQPLLPAPGAVRRSSAERRDRANPRQQDHDA
jgi:hypothetical protein